MTEEIEITGEDICQELFEELENERLAIEGEHLPPPVMQTVMQHNKQAIFFTYHKLSEWVAWAQPLAMNMQRGRMDGVSEEVMVVNYVSRNSQ